MNEKPWEKYHRKKPIKEFDVNQTLYNLVKNENKNDLNNAAIGYLGTTKSYKDLFNDVDRLADAYHKIGVTDKDVVGVCLIITPAVQQNLLAISKIGAMSKWIDVRVKAKDLINDINNSGCKYLIAFEGMQPLLEEIINETDLKKVIISSPKDYLAPPIRILADLKDKKEGKLLKLPEDSRFIKFNDFIQSGDKNSTLVPARFEKEKPTLSIQSSGSTGKAKSIIHTDYNFNTAIQNLAYTDLPFYKGKILYVIAPPFIIYGLNNSFYSSLVFQMKTELNPNVGEDLLYKDLGKYTMPFGVPLHYRYMLKEIKNLRARIDDLKDRQDSKSKNELKKLLKELNRVLDGLKKVDVFVSGGDKITTDEIIEMQQEFDRTIVNGYGNNEVVGAAVVSPRYANKSGAIGIPVHGIDVKIFDPETNKMLNQGELGEICLQTNNSFLEYFGNPEETKKIKQLHDDGKYWIHTGDLGRIDNDGYIILEGRTRRIIYSDAYKISPDAIENQIQQLSFIKSCIVVGVPDPVKKSVPMAFIELDEAHKNNFNSVLPEIKEYCKKELPDYETPLYFEEIESVPYTSNNKQDFRKLEEMGKDFVENQTKLVRKKQK